MILQPKISIIMPVLNGGRTIEKAINSVVQQSYANYELIILDGGSTDNTIDIIRRYEKNISYWHSKHDGNPCLAVNEGIERATGDLVVQLMSDDFYEPETLQRVAEALCQHPDADIITCGGRIIFFDETSHTYRAKTVYASQTELDLNFYNVCFAVSAICCRFVRKSLFVKIGSFIATDPQGKMPHSNDKEFLLRAIVYGAKNVTIDYIGHNYLAHAGSFTFSGSRAMTVKLYIQHMWFAEMYLAKPELDAEQRAMMHYWYQHQSARLAFYYLFKRRFREGYAVMQKDLPRYHLRWLFSFVTAAPDFWWRRSVQFIKKIYHQFSGNDIVYGKVQ